jgi:hypothetical protein
MMFITSIPAKVLCADSNSLNPVLMQFLRLIFLWSCSTILFRYLQLLRLMRLKLLAFTVRIASEFAPRLSMLITLGLPLFPMALLRNFWAEPFILLFVSRKSTVFTYLSTARYRYLLLPPNFNISLVHSPTIADTALSLMHIRLNQR